MTEETPSKSILNVMPVPLTLSHTKSNSEDKSTDKKREVSELESILVRLESDFKGQLELVTCRLKEIQT